MNTQDALQAAESILRPIASQVTRPAPNRLDAVVPTGRLLTAVEGLRSAKWGYLSAITGLDWPPSPAKNIAPASSPTPAAVPGEPAPPEGGHVEALYHFCDGDAVTTLRVMVSYADARIPSICGLIPAATLYERELGEMLGITVEGTPVTEHLLLPDEWPQGVYPLRKAFTGKLEAAQKV